MVAKLIVVFGGLWLLLVVALWRITPEIRRYLETRQEAKTRREQLRTERVDKLVEEAERSVGESVGADPDEGESFSTLNEGETDEETDDRHS